MMEKTKERTLDTASSKQVEAAQSACSDEFSSYLTERNDLIDQTAFSLLDALAADSLVWDMEQIGDLIDAAKRILSGHGIEVCHPSYIGEDGQPCIHGSTCKSFMCPYWLMHI